MTQSTLLIARLYENIQPMDRGERYEDPLNAALRARAAGSVQGGGSQLDQSGEIAFVDIEIELASMDDSLQFVVETLEQAGAPEGSEIRRGGEVIREFGKQQCVAIYLDGVSLPAEVYANLDFGEVVESLGSAAGPNSYHSYWQGAQETGVFFFASSADDVFARMEPVLRSLPIGQNARVVVRAGKPGLPSRTVRMPRQ